MLRRGIGTLATADAWSLFDQIILSGAWLKPEGAGWRFYKAEVFNRDFLTERRGIYKGYPRRSFCGPQWNGGYSDHFPVLVHLVRPARQ